MSDVALLIGALLAPLVAAILVGLTGRRPNVREAMSLICATAAFACTAVLLPRVAAGARPELWLAEPLPGIELKFVLEPIGAMFACLATFLWIVTTIYAIGYMRGHGERNQTRFFACFALALHAVVGAAAAGNLLTLFVCYELLTVTTYPLVTHAGTERAFRAGRVYIGILLGTSIGLLLLAILWTHSIAGGGDFVDGGLLAPAAASGNFGPGVAMALFTLFAFGIGKAALMPFHRWLPAAMVAPTPVSALLHAVAVVKTGVFALLKVAVYVFGVDGLSASGASVPIAWVAAFTMLVASLIALSRDDLKERLAYSTIAQLAYIVAGVATATAAGVVGAGLHMVTHAFGKITLFFVAGAVIVAAHRTSIRSMTGLGRAMPFTFAAFAIATASIVGLPPTGGTWSKWWLGAGLAGAERPWLLGVLLVSSLLSAAYLVPIAVRAFAGGHANAHDAHHAHDAHDAHDAHAPTEAPIACRIAIGLTAAMCVAAFFLLDPLQRMLASVVVR